MTTWNQGQPDMRTYVYRAQIERGDEAEWVVSFPAVPEAITQAETIAAARHAAQDALGLALLSYPLRGKPLPATSPADEVAASHDPAIHDADIQVAPEVAAKLAVLEAFQQSGRSPSDLASMLAVEDTAVADILDPMHPTEFQILSDALEALGQRLIIGVSAIEEAA